MTCFRGPISSARSRFSREQLSLDRNKSISSVGSETETKTIGGGEDDECRAGLWANILPEVLSLIIRKVDESEQNWPQRRIVVACACVCKTWREVVKDVVISSRISTGLITFPSCLKQPGPREVPRQCIIVRNKKTDTFCLRLAVANTFSDKGKFLLVARKIRRGAHTDYIISLDSDDISMGSNSYVGKISCSDIFGTKFKIYDSNPPHIGAKPSCSRTTRRFATNQICPQVPAAANFDVGQLSYKFSFFKSRGPRRINCSIKTHFPQSIDTKPPDKKESEPFAILQNKTPRWHEHLQCWCLNFHGRVTVASVKNFQLVASVDPSQPENKGNEDTVLQFGKVGDDTFTMDYRRPLSAFQAFAICLSSSGTKLA